MNHFLLTRLTTLTFVILIHFISQAKPITYNFHTVSETSVRRIAPGNLVTMAQRGRFRAPGISSTSDYVLSQINAKESVRAEIAAKLLPKDTRNNSSYLSAVASKL
ncbi:MAG: hypothetical protein ACFB4I_22040 [Cyanophyceae cyanobacterium]